MSMQSIRDRYGVPAKRGARVICNGDPATITGSSRTAEHLMVRFDDEPGRTYPIHPTWRVEYLAEVGLAPAEDPDPSRCPMRATDPITTRHPRDDGWRCGHEAGHTGGHTLYSADGESVLYAGRWVHQAEVGLTEKTGTES